MRIYRLSFVKNTVVSCNEITENIGFDGIYHYEHNNGQLIYAIIKAENEDNALTIANFIVRQLQDKLRTKDADTN